MNIALVFNTGIGKLFEIKTIVFFATKYGLAINTTDDDKLWLAWNPRRERAPYPSTIPSPYPYLGESEHHT